MDEKQEDPFWQKRDEEINTAKERQSKLQEFKQQSTPPRRRNQKEKIDPAKMEPAGRTSVERMKQDFLEKGFSSIKITSKKDDSQVIL